MMRGSSLLLVFAVLGGCLEAGSGPAVSGAGGGAGGPGGTGGGAADGLPCAVAEVLVQDCSACHGATLSGGAPVRLTTAAELRAPSTLDPALSFGQRSVIRMRASTGAMPPAPAAPVSAPRLAAFEAWVNDGMPAGSCASGTGGGAGGAGGSGGSGGAGGGTVDPYDGGVAGLPCDVAGAVASKCASCHRDPPLGGATFALLSRADFLAPSLVDPTKNQAQRAQLRIADAQSPMPPAGSPPFTTAERAAFDAWVNAGAPVGSCGTVDAGTPPDGGLFPTTCSSNAFWTAGDDGDEKMNPGLACRGCHTQKAPFKAYYFSGTAYSTPHEKDRCNAVAPPAGTKIEILDKNGAVATTLTPNAVGNFHSIIFNLVQLPYTARITANGKTLTMTTPQTETDCNSCHTEQGKNGASGRIVWPQ